jgi:orotidine-5'-phosphate decarboxylase
MTTFREKWQAASDRQNSLLCVGLDPEPARLPVPLRASGARAAVTFCQRIIEATLPYVCAYKPNLAFFEALGAEGWLLLTEVLQAIPAHIPVIADAKRGDIGHTARLYAEALFERCAFDAATVNPYVGYDGIAPFLAYREKLVFVLCRTSNPGARDFQDLAVADESGQLRPLYQRVAELVRRWNAVNGNCGLVVGATYPQELQAIRALCPELPLLVPGVGAQGGDLAAAVKAGVDAGGAGLLVAISRAILYADSGSDYANAAAEAARRFRDQINRARGR